MEAYQQLELEWTKFNDLDPTGMVACSSGTAALHLALEALHLPLGSKVVMPDFTMVACARAVTLAGLEPVFVDCDEQLLMDSKLWVSAIDGPTEAVMFVHVYGRQCEFPKTWDKYATSLRIIEDLAEAHGIKPHVQTDAACWSFYKNKIVAGEEGGAVWFRDPKHAALARSLRSLGFTDNHDFNHIPRGHNYRMSNAHAELILINFAREPNNFGGARWIDYLMSSRNQIVKWYDKHCPQEWKMSSRDAPWVYDLRIQGMTWASQDKAIQSLNSAGIAARHSFKPMHSQEEFRECKFVYGSQGHKSSILSSQILYLPISPGVTTETSIKSAFSILREFFPERA